MFMMVCLCIEYFMEDNFVLFARAIIYIKKMYKRNTRETPLPSYYIDMFTRRALCTCDIACTCHIIFRYVL